MLGVCCVCARERPALGRLSNRQAAAHPAAPEAACSCGRHHDASPCCEHHGVVSHPTSHQHASLHCITAVFLASLPRRTWVNLLKPTDCHSTRQLSSVGSPAAGWRWACRRTCGSPPSHPVCSRTSPSVAQACLLQTAVMVKGLIATVSLAPACPSSRAAPVVADALGARTLPVGLGVVHAATLKGRERDTGMLGQGPLRTT